MLTLICAEDFFIEDEAEDEAALSAQFSASYEVNNANELEAQEALLMAKIAKMRAVADVDMSRSIAGGAPEGLDPEGLWTYWMVSVRVCLNIWELLNFKLIVVQNNRTVAKLRQ